MVCTVSIIYHINPCADTNQVGGAFAVVGTAEKRYGTDDTLRNDQCNYGTTSALKTGVDLRRAGVQ